MRTRAKWIFVAKATALGARVPQAELFVLWPDKATIHPRLFSGASDKGRYFFMAFFNSAVGVLQTLVVALGAGLGIWGAINLLEGYGNDNPGAKSQGMKQLMAGGGVALIGMVLVPLLSGLFS